MEEGKIERLNKLVKKSQEEDIEVLITHNQFGREETLTGVIQGYDHHREMINVKCSVIGKVKTLPKNTILDINTI